MKGAVLTIYEAGFAGNSVINSLNSKILFANEG